MISLIESNSQRVRNIISNGAKDTEKIGRRLGETLKPGDVVGLSGPLGSGKTVFVRGVAAALGIQERITSPTFTLISEYEGNMPLYHLDLYRIHTPEEFVWLGVEEMIGGNGISLIEWSERAAHNLPERTIRVTIAIADNDSRLISISKPSHLNS